MSTVGIDFTEAEFDLRNAEISEQIKVDFPEDTLFTTYATKSCPTLKGYWMQVIIGYEKYFSVEEIAGAVEYVPIEEEEETYEI